MSTWSHCSRSGRRCYRILGAIACAVVFGAERTGKHIEILVSTVRYACSPPFIHFHTNVLVLRLATIFRNEATSRFTFRIPNSVSAFMSKIAYVSVLWIYFNVVYILISSEVKVEHLTTSKSKNF